MSRKLLVLSLAVALVLAVAGCSQTSENQNSQPANSTATTNSSQTNVNAASAGEYMDVSVMEAKDLIDQLGDDLVIIDVSPDYDAGHLPGAVNYYLGDGSLDDAIPDLDQSKSYLVYCHADAPSISGAEKLVDAGFIKVYRLEGNYAAWVDAGYVVE